MEDCEEGFEVAESMISRIFRVDIVPEECDFNLSSRNVWKRLRASYFKRVISMATRSIKEIARPDSKSLNPIDEAPFKQEVLYFFLYFYAPNSKILFDWYLFRYFDIQSTWKEFFTSRPFEDFRILGHAFLEIPYSLNNNSFQSGHETTVPLRIKI